MAKQSDSKVVLEVPKRTDFAWSDYVMTFFQPEELADGNPTCVGLSRVAELLIGPIVSSKPTQIFPTAGNGVGRATVAYEIVFDVGVQKTLTYADVADVWTGNTDLMFAGFAVATASTRAEARCLRKALKLRKISAEEVCQKDVAKEVAAETDTAITPDQSNMLEKFCKKLNLNLITVLLEYNEVKGLQQVPKATAARIIQDLSSWNNKRELIKPHLLGYSEDWK